jgi:hypothetical protein
MHCHYAECHYAECCGAIKIRFFYTEIFFTRFTKQAILMRRANVLSVPLSYLSFYLLTSKIDINRTKHNVMLNVVMLSAILLNVIHHIMLGVIVQIEENQP